MAKMTLLSVFSQVMRQRPFGVQQSPIIYRAYITNAPNPVIGTNDLENPTTEGTSDQVQNPRNGQLCCCSGPVFSAEFLPAKLCRVDRTAQIYSQPIGEAAHEIREEVKETVHDACESAKEMADEAKSRAAGVVEQTAECVQANAEKVERAINTKN